MNAERTRPSITKQANQRQGSGSHVPVLTRLQALFPSNPNANSPITESPELANTSSKELKKALKVRIITWNMHDSLPKGDVEELLGKVPVWTESASRPGIMPSLPLEPGHPYHFVVVAGQECPTLSGIPMGLGASWRRQDNKDRDWEKEREKELEKEGRRREKEEAAKVKKNDDVLHDVPSGWSSLLDEWYCQGHSLPRRSPSPNTADISLPKPLAPRSEVTESKKGPYQLLVKERMMGIYLAVFIHRDLKPLVRGTSHSAVTAGLIGGRVGNKGGVGISVNLDGTTILFLNAHLAAHEGRIQHRLANLAKIKTELSVDDFLSPDSPKYMAEDLTDRFDYTFLFGDLNFRLDITRLHADWLISRRDYAQALAFDQLLNIMKDERAFVGFKEAPINFPPTFKYDVLRSLKHIRRKQTKLGKSKKHGEYQLTEVEEKEIEELEEEEARANEERDGGEGASLASSAWTSARSRNTERDDDEDMYASPSMQQVPSSQSKASIASQAAQKAKNKCLSLISRSSSVLNRSRPHIHIPSMKRKQGIRSSVDVATNRTGANSPTPTDRSRPRPASVVMASSTTKASLADDEDEDYGKGVYDSSAKQRVPSWCDRIVWKSTIEPDPEPEEEIPEHLMRPRARFGQFFANAFRPLSSRPRRDSIVSIATTTTTTSESYDDDVQSPPSSSQDAGIPRDAAPPPGCLNRRPPAPDMPLRRSTSATFSVAARTNSPTVVDLHQPPVRRGRGQTTTSTIPYTQTPNIVSRWKFLPSFLSLHSNHSDASTEPASNAEPGTPRKGDIICLSYDTLDDRGMRRLEGRSDHRPVIGSYAIYM